jgi:hypothetical protein
VLDDENLLERLRQLTSSSHASTAADHGGVRKAVSRSALREATERPRQLREAVEVIIDRTGGDVDARGSWPTAIHRSVAAPSKRLLAST